MATLPPGRLKPMTLLVGLRGADGLVVAADSRGTFGDPRGITAQNDQQKKLYITSKYSAVLTAGAGELGANLMESVLKEIQGTEGVTQSWTKPEWSCERNSRSCSLDLPCSHCRA